MAVVRVALGLLALRGVRWAYVGFIALGLLYFPARVGFALAPRPCQLAFDAALAAHSMTNYAHVVMFALFFVMTRAQFREWGLRTFAWLALATLVMGALVELAQGVTGEGNCRARDLIPDAAGALVGAAVVSLLDRAGWRPRPTWSLTPWRRDGGRKDDEPDGADNRFDSVGL